MTFDLFFGSEALPFSTKVWSWRLGRDKLLVTSHGLQLNKIFPGNLTADLIRATGNAVFAPALQRSCDIVRDVGPSKPCDVTFTALPEAAGIKAILIVRKTFHGKISHLYVSMKTYSRITRQKYSIHLHFKLLCSIRTGKVRPAVPFLTQICHLE